jgi:hypothetical protein
VPQIEQRVAQAKRRGYSCILVPITQRSLVGKNVVGVSSIADLDKYFVSNAEIAVNKSALSDEEKEDIKTCA